MRAYVTTFSAVVLFGLVQTATCKYSCRNNRESYFTVDLKIQPRKSTFNTSSCDNQDASFRLERLIKYVIDRKFDVYKKNTHYMDSVQIEKLCGGVQTTERRDLGLSLTTLGWSYTCSTSSKCRFCLPDVSDGTIADAGPPLEVYYGLVNGTYVVLSNYPSMAPSSAPSEAITLSPTSSSLETRLQERLERQIRRKLQKKINRIKNSCLQGSSSRVDVSLTSVGEEHPPRQCP